MNNSVKKLQLPSDTDSTGRDLGSEELETVRQVLASGCLFSPKGTFVRKLESEFATRYGRKYAHACSSGSAAVHVAVGAINPNPGDEIITTSVTDMGALTAILYQERFQYFVTSILMAIMSLPKQLKKESPIEQRQSLSLISSVFPARWVR